MAMTWVEARVPNAISLVAPPDTRQQPRLLLSPPYPTMERPMQSENPKVLMRTSHGEITLELDATSAPVTVENFLGYVRDGFYDGTIFHRVIDGFMIQGGGFTPDMQQKPTGAPIENEAGNGLRNERGTIAMARTQVVNSATAQFFINLADNEFLNHRDTSPMGFGYAVFGKVVEGMETVDAIRAVATGNVAGHGDVPTSPVTIESATVA